MDSPKPLGYFRYLVETLKPEVLLCLLLRFVVVGVKLFFALRSLRWMANVVVTAVTEVVDYGMQRWYGKE